MDEANWLSNSSTEICRRYKLLMKIIVYYTLFYKKNFYKNMRVNARKNIRKCQPLYKRLDDILVLYRKTLGKLKKFIRKTQPCSLVLAKKSSLASKKISLINETCNGSEILRGICCWHVSHNRLPVAYCANDSPKSEWARGFDYMLNYILNMIKYQNDGLLYRNCT